MNLKSFIALAVASAALPLSSRAEEAASGHYMPGATASFIDALPGRPALAVANFFTYYDGSANASHSFEFGGEIVANARATVYANNVVAIYQTPWRLLGGNYAAGIALPFVSMDVRADVIAGPLAGSRHDSASGFGDIMLLPFMLGWTNACDLKYDVRLAVYAPSGDYEVGQLANVGRNYWTFEPAVSVSWLSTKIGTEATLFAGFDINTKNNATDYQSGASFHLDGTLAQHLPLGKLGFIGVGANGFLYQQITGDSGSGAKLGDFEGRTAGVGPVVSFVTKIGNNDLAIEAKWLPELNVQKRLKGDIVWVKIGLVF